MLRQGRRVRAPGDLDDLERAHDPAGVARADAVGGDRVPAGQLGVQRPRTLGLDPRLEACAHLGVGAGELHVVEQRADVEPRAARPRPRGRRATRCPAARRGRAPGSRRRTRPRAGRARRAGGAGRPRARRACSLAVPMSMPRYSCIASALTTSPPSACASASPRSDLPVAVGPTTATTRVAARCTASVDRRPRRVAVRHRRRRRRRDRLGLPRRPGTSRRARAKKRRALAIPPVICRSSCASLTPCS